MLITHKLKTEAIKPQGPYTLKWILERIGSKV